MPDENQNMPEKAPEIIKKVEPKPIGNASGITEIVKAKDNREV